MAMALPPKLMRPSRSQVPLRNGLRTVTESDFDLASNPPDPTPIEHSEAPHPTLPGTTGHSQRTPLCVLRGQTAVFWHHERDTILDGWF